MIIVHKQDLSLAITGEMERVGTPYERDDDRDAVLTFLGREGGLQLTENRSPRALVRGRYEAEDARIVMHMRRLKIEGTFVNFDLKVDSNTIVDVVLDMLYPYQLGNPTEYVGKYQGLLRHTLTNYGTGCRTWRGFGYTLNHNDYVSVSEHVFPRSAGYGWHHSEVCIKNTDGRWNWCNGKAACGKKAWVLHLTVFEVSHGLALRQKLDLELTLVLFNADEHGLREAKISVAIDGNHKGWVKSCDKEDAKLRHYDLDLLKRSAGIFLKSKRAQARGTHPPGQEAYLTTLFQPPEDFVGAPLEPAGQQSESVSMMRSLLQLLGGCEAFNFVLLVKILYDQLYATSPCLPFIRQLWKVMRGEGQMETLMSELGDLPEGRKVFEDHDSYPEILILLLKFMYRLEETLTWAKFEAPIRKLPATLFRICTRWNPVNRCEACDELPKGAQNQPAEFHFPAILLLCKDREPLDLGGAFREWLEGRRRQLGRCKNYPNCR